MTDRAVLINDTEAWYHWGCTATSRGLKGLIGTRYTLADCVAIHELQALEEAPQSPLQFPDEDFFARHRAANDALYERIAQADVAFVNGEGTIHGTGHQATNLLYVAWASKTYLNKPVYLVNHSFYPGDGEPETPPMVARFYTRVYRDFDYVAVREPRSEAEARALGIDATLAFDCLPRTLRELGPFERRDVLVVAGSVAFPEAAYEPFAAYLTAMASTGLEIELLSGAPARPATDERRFVERLTQELPAGGWRQREATSLEEWCEALGSARALVSGRFHHSLAAYTLATPFVALESNTPKITGLTEMLGLPPPLGYDEATLSDRLAARTLEILDRAPAPELDRLLALAEKNLPPD